MSDSPVGPAPKALPSHRPALALVVLITAVLALGVRAYVQGGGAQSAALLGLALSALSAFVVLGLKRLALMRGIRYALLVVGASFALRVLLLAIGTVWVRTHGGKATPFLLGFLVSFGALQWVEFGYLAVASRRRA